MANEPREPEEFPSVVALISAYNPSPSLQVTVEAALAQTPHVLIVDDHSGRFDEDLKRDLVARGAVIIRLDRNSGIAAALNEAVVRSRDLWSADFYLTLDQDSTLGADYVKNALATFVEATALGLKVGAVAPESYSGRTVLTDRLVGGFSSPFDAWQSGMLVPAAVWSTLGGLEPDMFIDAVDSEFTLHMKRCGYEILMGMGCDVEHALGERREGQIFGIRRSFTAHSPLRVYYMARNAVFLVKRYWMSAPTWLLRKSAHDLRNHATRLAFGEKRLVLIRAIFLGMRDGLVGRMGPARAETAQRLLEK